MSKISDLAPVDKPREKAKRFGIENLSDEELLALIISSGTTGHSSLDIARDLLDDCHYLNELMNKSAEYFYHFKGLKVAKAMKLIATMEIAKRINEKRLLIYEEEGEVTSESLFRRYKMAFGKHSQEVLSIIILNKNKRIIYETVLYRGNDNAILLNTRDIIRLLLIHNGYYFYLIHNHPNDSLFPSEADLKFTQKIMNKTQSIGITMLDHLIITMSGYYSFIHDKIYQ